MQDTTQIKGKSFETLSGNSGSLRDWTRSIVDFQKSTLEQHNMEKETQKEADAKNLFVSSLNSKDHGVSQECNSTFRLYQVAKGIRNYFAKPENGGYDYTNVDDDVLYDGYVKNNPDRKAQLDRYVLDDSQICDPTQLYQDMGWEDSEDSVPTSTEMEDDGPDNFVDWVKNVGKSFLSFYETGGDFVRNAVQGGIGLLEGDQTPGALENYADMNYGTDFYSLTDEQKQKARDTISTEEGLNTYKPTLQRAILKGMEAGLDAVITVTAPWMKASFSVGENTPGISDLLEIGGVVLQGGGRLVNHSTPLYFYRDTLQTEEEKQEFDAFVGTLGFMKLFQKRGGRNKVEGGGIKDTLLKEIDPVTTVEEFKKRIVDIPSDAKKLGKKIGKGLSDQGEIIARMNKLTPSEKLTFQDKFGGEKYGDFLNRVSIIEGDEGAIMKLNAYKSSLFDQITNALEEIKGEYDVNNPRMQEMIKENIRNAKDVMERDPAIINRLSKIADKYFKEVKNPDGSTRIYGKLNAPEIKFLMRYFAEKTRLGFNKDTEPKKVQRHDNIYAQVLDDITRIAEENGYENMKEMSRDIQKSHFLINALGKDLAKKYGKSGLDATDLLALYGDLESGGLKLIVKKLITSEWAKKNYVKILNKLKGFTPDVQIANLEKIREINSKNMFDKWVKEIENDSKTPKLGENPQYSNNPVDYTTPTRVTPSGESAQYGQILETKKNTGLEEK